MKSVLLTCYNLKVGGIQKSLVNFVNNISSNLDVTLFLFNKNGKYIDDIPKSVHIITPTKKYQIIGMSSKECRQESLFLFLLRSIVVFFCKLFGNENIMPEFLKKLNVPGEYDYAISFAQNGDSKTILYGCNIAALKSNHKKVLSFIHCDPKATNLFTKVNKNEYKAFDLIVTVSNSIKSYVMEELKTDNVVCLYNTHNIDRVVSLSNDGCDFVSNNIVTFVTVCRLSEEKGVDRIISTCELLEKQNIKYRWIVVGSSNKENEYKQEAMSHNVHNLYFVGEKINPFPYIRIADYLVISSYHEAAPMVLDEASILGKPVLSTKYGYSTETLPATNICENNNEAFTSLIFDAIKNPDKPSISINNEDRINKIFEVLS